MTTAGRLPDARFWHDRRVLLTGHTGFKGSWAALWLTQLGANVTGLSLAPAQSPNLFQAAHIAGDCSNLFVDLTQRSQVEQAMSAARPDIIVHMAAQALVRQSYRDPVGTIATNVMGTAHLLDAAAAVGTAKTILVVTSDKVYANDEAGRAFSETDRLGGHDPYSSSKSACEMISLSFASSILEPAGIRLATARAGNVIGGGDFSTDRIVPDIWRAARADAPLRLRQPEAWRPWQHVLDCLAGYLVYVEALAAYVATPRSLNFGPLPGKHLAVGEIATLMLGELGGRHGWVREATPQPKEMSRLSIDPALSRRTLAVSDRWPDRIGVLRAADWYRDYNQGMDARTLTLSQLKAFTDILEGP